MDVDFAAVKLAQVTGRPVKIVLNYDEVLAAYRQRNAMNAMLRIGLRKNGSITALYAENILEGGHISGIGPFNIYYFGAFLNIPIKSPQSSTMEAGVRQQGALRHRARPGDRACPILPSIRFCTWQARTSASTRWNSAPSTRSRTTGRARTASNAMFRVCRNASGGAAEKSDGRSRGRGNPRGEASVFPAHPIHRARGWAATSDRRSC